jgi:hypothetical protein
MGVKRDSSGNLINNKGVAATSSTSNQENKAKKKKTRTHRKNEYKQ